MTPAAHHAAAIEILDQIFLGAPADRILVNWTRGHRFAGSKDRAAIRDIVFDCLRCKRSFQAIAGGQGARACVIGSVVAAKKAVQDVFSGEGYAPQPLSEAEQTAIRGDCVDSADPVRLDYPDWLDAPLAEVLGDQKHSVMGLLKKRAPTAIRVNARTAVRDSVAKTLASDGIVSEMAHCKTGLIVKENARRLSQSVAYLNGQIELQDIGAQVLCQKLLPYAMGNVLDYCAGGGGKSLAIAAESDANLFAYDQNAQRMKDIQPRAERAGAKIEILKNDPVASNKDFNLVILDVPCSGTGTWRRTPDAKWRFTSDQLDNLVRTQAEILQTASELVKEGGYLAYITCSLLQPENEGAIDPFIEQNGQFSTEQQETLFPTLQNDGFFFSLLKKNTPL